MAFQNLKGELTRAGVTQRKVADFLGMSTNNFNRKVAEEVAITREEMYSIRDEFLPDRSIDYLFESDGNVPSKAESLHAQAEVAYEAALEAEEISDEEAEELRGLLHECADTACEKKHQAIKA